MDKNLYSDLEKTSNEDSSYSGGQNKKLYVVNFTPIRLIAFVVSFFVVFITLFTLGFSLGSSGKGASSLSSANNVLMREDNNTMNSGVVPNASSEIANSINSKRDETIVDMKTLRNAGGIVVEGDNVESSKNYDDYTVTLNRELESMNNEIKERLDIIESPRTVTAPKMDNMYIQVPVPDPLPPVKTSSTSKVTKTPYTDGVDGNIYYIQVAVGYNKNYVEKESEKIRKISTKTFVKEETKDGDTMYKLKVGRFTSRADAEKVLSEIRKTTAYKDSYIYTDNK